MLGVVVGFLFLEESHEDKKDRRDLGLELGNWILKRIRYRGRTKEETPEEAPLFLSEDKISLPLNSTDSSPRLSTVSTSVSEIDVFIPKTDLLRPKKSYTWRETFSNQSLLVILGLGILAL